MHIESFTSIAPIGSVSSSSPVVPVAKTKTDAATQTTAPAGSSSSAPAATLKSATASHGSGGGTDSAGTSSSSEELVAEYSTTVDGKSYGGSVEESGNEYTATASGLAGASVSGSSITAAENNLAALISVLA